MDPNDFDLDNEISLPASEDRTEVSPERAVETSAEDRPNHDDWIRQAH